MACNGNKIVLVHHRIDFMMYAMDAIVNWMSLWRFKSSSDTSLSITIRAIVGKGGDRVHNIQNQCTLGLQIYQALTL